MKLGAADLDCSRCREVEHRKLQTKGRAHEDFTVRGAELNKGGFEVW
ncbi:hypothetical protein CCHR01_16386 [Colletotrichum chrysophilum]|uniref:Uncharacterized protein n=1 Tax=Colletotrichum chrysophilum TaxID=1836956 RepID=A0AAD9A5V0_9PEZI|nr:hypothetical protein CCHR01_16386 [Colletotrichum chrysophilum]